MSIPTTGKQALATATNPLSIFTNQTLFIDLSRLGAEWWNDSNTSDGPRGRACKLDGTELPCDWIYFDNTLRLGVLAVKWLGDLETSGDQQVYVFPPNTRNTAYAATDTYGQHNAHKSDLGGYWPLIEDFNDRTSNQRHGTARGGVTAGGSAGLLGVATAFDGVDDWIEITPIFSGGETDFTFLGFYKGTTNDSSYIGQGSSSSSSPRIMLNNEGAKYVIAGSGEIALITDTPYDGTWHQLAGTADDLLLDGESIAAGSVSIPTGTYDNFGIGGFNRGGSLHRPITGDMQHVFAVSDSWPVNLAAYIRDQIFDNATFWGDWVISDVSGEIDASGSINSASALSADAFVIRNASGAIGSVSLLTGNSLVVRNASGGIESISLLSGNAEITAPIDAAGSIGTTSVISGSAKINRNASGAIESVSIVSGNATLIIPASGKIESVSSISGNAELIGFIDVSGAITSISELSGNAAVSGIIEVAGAILSSSRLSGSAKLDISISGEINSISKISGNASTHGDIIDGPLIITITGKAGGIGISGKSSGIAITGKSGTIIIKEV